MGNCKYCGKPAGFLRRRHTECEEQHVQRERVAEAGRQAIVGEVVRAIKTADNFDALENRIG